jgi:hypothetical protein
MDNANNLNQRIIRSSSVALTITSGNFLELRQQITDIYNKKVALLKNLKSEKLKLYGITSLYFLSLICIVGFLTKKISNKKKDQKSVVDGLNKEISDTFVNIAFADKSQLEKSWLNCVDGFNDLMKSEKIWDLTYSEDLNSVKMRTTAKTAIKRSLVDKSIKRNLDFIKCDLPCLFIPNANGPDLFIFPTFFIFFKNYREFGIFDLKEIIHTLEFNRFIEEEGVPKDSETIDYTWKKANKNGSPDKRFKGNYQIPIVKYGQLFFQSKNGLDEGYMFSNSLSFSRFLESYNFHLSILKK